MEAKHKLRKKLIDISGYWFYRKNHLPIGADFTEDLKKLGLSVETIFDVGANYGQTALYYAENFPLAKIYSFEPVKESYRKMVGATQHIKSVSCFNYAFGESIGTAEIPLFNEEKSQLNSLKTANMSSNADAVTEIVTIQTIDAFLEDHRIQKIDLLKIDTEGYEVEVLKGAGKSLASEKINLILCEAALCSENGRNTQIIDIITYLKPYNFTLLGMYDTNINYLKEGLAYSNILFVRTSL